jgi:hypothetical protein
MSPEKHPSANRNHQYDSIQRIRLLLRIAGSSLEPPTNKATMEDYSIDKLRVERLNGPNYRAWALLVQTILYSKGLWQVAERQNIVVSAKSITVVVVEVQLSKSLLGYSTRRWCGCCWRPRQNRHNGREAVVRLLPEVKAYVKRKTI